MIFQTRTRRLIDDDAPARVDVDGVNAVPAAVRVEDFLLQQPANLHPGGFQAVDKAGQSVAPARPRHIDGGGKQGRWRICVRGWDIGRCLHGAHTQSLRRLARESMRVVKS